MVRSRFCHRVRPVHPWSGAPLGSSGSIGTVGFIRVRPVGVWDHSGCLASLGCVWGLSGSFRVVGFPRVRPGCPRVTSGSLD